MSNIPAGVLQAHKLQVGDVVTIAGLIYSSGDYYPYSEFNLNSVEIRYIEPNLCVIDKNGKIRAMSDITCWKYIMEKKYIPHQN